MIYTTRFLKLCCLYFTKFLVLTFKISNNGIWSIVFHNDAVFVGSGDGKVKKLKGKDTKWILEAEILLSGSINSMSVDKNNNEILAGTSEGNLYRIFPDDLSAALHTEGHVSSINGISFQKDNNEIFATIT